MGRHLVPRDGLGPVGVTGVWAPACAGVTELRKVGLTGVWVPAGAAVTGEMAIGGDVPVRQRNRVETGAEDGGQFNQ